jgi:phospholipid transport system substrate-binding protein
MMRLQGLYSASRRVAHGMCAAAMVCLILSAPGLAQPEAAKDPRAFVDALGSDVLAIIKSPNISMAERQQRFRDLFQRAFDVPKIARFVVGRYWNRASPDEQTKYLDVFGSYVSTIYASQFAQYQGESFKTAGLRQIGDGESVVQSEIVRGGNPSIQVGFRVDASSGSFKIVDVTVEGVSLIVTKRDEFGSVLSQEGMSGVIKRMQAVVDQGAVKHS